MCVPALAVCGTTPHCTKLELLLTEFLYAELGREGSTYYMPDFDSGEKSEAQVEPKAATKEKPQKKTPKNPGKPTASKEKEQAQPSEEKNGTKRNAADSKEKPNKKAKKQEEEVEDEAMDSDGSMPW